MALPKAIALAEDQIEEIMATQWNMRVASIGPGERLNLTPMWFGGAGGAI